MSSTSFEETLAAARAGQNWACAELYDDLKGPVTGFVRLRGADEPDEVVSETFLQVFRSLEQFRGDQKGFRSWVFTIAHRRVIDARRSRDRRLSTIPLTDRIDASDERDPDAHAAPIDGDIAAVLDQLTDDQRTVVLLHVVGGLSHREIARTMGRSSASVKALQHRAISALRRALAAEDATPSADVTISEAT